MGGACHEIADIESWDLLDPHVNYALRKSHPRAKPPSRVRAQARGRTLSCVLPALSPVSLLPSRMFRP